MKIGDKVRFLNTTGGGIVRGFKNKDIAIVDDDGFDTPVLIRECVVIEPAHDTQVRQGTQATADVIQQAATNRHIAQDYVVEESKKDELLSVIIAYLPVNIKSLGTTNFECYLVNDSNYYLSYNYMGRSDNGWTSRNTGIIEPNTKLFIEEFDKSELNNIEKVCLQFFAYKEGKTFDLKNAYSVEIRIDTVKFYKLHSFRPNDYFDDEALIYTAVHNDLPSKELIISAEELEMAIAEKEPRKRIETIARKQQSDVIEVDLHSDALLDNTNGMSPADILEYQLDTFRKTMNENMRRKGARIVFIHGKGDGILKNSIIKELKTNYKTTYYQDASFREYGYGATMVTIK